MRVLKFEAVAPIAAAAALALSGLLAGGGQALVGRIAGTVLGGVLTPGLRAVGAALVVAVQQGGHGGGQQFAVGTCGDGVHGARRGRRWRSGSCAEAVGGGVFGAAAHLVDAGVSAVVRVWSASLVTAG